MFLSSIIFFSFLFLITKHISFSHSNGPHHVFFPQMLSNLKNQSSWIVQNLQSRQDQRQTFIELNIHYCTNHLTLAPYGTNPGELISNLTVMWIAHCFGLQQRHHNCQSPNDRAINHFVKEETPKRRWCRPYDCTGGSGHITATHQWLEQHGQELLRSHWKVERLAFYDNFLLF